jgi:hypothetical protein
MMALVSSPDTDFSDPTLGVKLRVDDLRLALSAACWRTGALRLAALDPSAYGRAAW